MSKVNLVQKASIAINSLLPEIEKAKACNSVVESNNHNLILDEEDGDKSHSDFQADEDSDQVHLLFGCEQSWVIEVEGVGSAVEAASVDPHLFHRNFHQTGNDVVHGDNISSFVRWNWMGRSKALRRRIMAITSSRRTQIAPATGA